MGKLSESQKTEIKVLIADKLGIELEQVSDDSKLQGDLNCDSLDYTEILMVLEGEFDINIPDDEFDFGSETSMSRVYEIVELYIK